MVMNLFNRYCIRCHGVDGRGVWDIPGIPDFTDVRWQNYRSDAEIVRIIIEGRGAVMPQFRGALALDEAWGLAHYLRALFPARKSRNPCCETLPARRFPRQRPRAAPAGTPAQTRVSSVRIPPPSTMSGSSPFAR